MSTDNAKEVVRLATLSSTFRTAFRADFTQALTLFASDLNLCDKPPLSNAEIDGLLSITDEEYKAFARIVTAVGDSLDPAPRPVTPHFF